jgi:hypothetical protein
MKSATSAKHATMVRDTLLDILSQNLSTTRMNHFSRRCIALFNHYHSPSSV